MTPALACPAPGGPWRARKRRGVLGAVMMAAILMPPPPVSPAQAASARRAACGAGNPLRVAVDIGHSPGGGALSASGVREYVFNRRMAIELVRASQRKTALRLWLIHPRQGPLALARRPVLARQQGADVLLSIHHDSVNPKYLKTRRAGGRETRYSRAFHGYSLFVSRDNPRYHDSLRLAAALGRAFKAAGLDQSLHHAEPVKGEGRMLLRWDLGIYDAPFLVLRRAAMPAVLLETGVIVNPDEEARLNKPSWRATIIRQILKGLLEYCGKRGG